MDTAGLEHHARLNDSTTDKLVEGAAGRRGSLTRRRRSGVSEGPNNCFSGGRFLRVVENLERVGAIVAPLPKLNHGCD